MEAKKILEDNVEAKNESFVYYLSDKSFFDKNAFRLLMESIRQLSDEEVGISRTAQEISFVYGKILRCFLYHFDKNDEYKIKNMPKHYNKIIEILDKGVEYYYKTRI